MKNIIKVQENQRHYFPNFNDQLNKLLDRAIKSDLPTLAQIFKGNRYAEYFGVDFRTLKDKLNDYGGRSTLVKVHLDTDELSDYKVVILSGLKSFISRYFYKLKSDPEFCFNYFNNYHIENELVQKTSHDICVNEWPEVLSQNALLLANTKKPSKNYILNVADRTLFDDDHFGLSPIEMTDNGLIDQDKMRSYLNCEAHKSMEIPIWRVDSHFLTWAISTSCLHCPYINHLANYGLHQDNVILATDINVNSKTTQLYLADKFVLSSNLDDLSYGRLDDLSYGRSLPLITSHISPDDKESPLFYGDVIKFFMNKICLSDKDGKLYFRITYQGHSYKERAHYKNSSESFLVCNTIQIIKLLYKVFMLPDVYEYGLPISRNDYRGINPYYTLYSKLGIIFAVNSFPVHGLTNLFMKCHDYTGDYYVFYKSLKTYAPNLIKQIKSLIRKTCEHEQDDYIEENYDTQVDNNITNETSGLEDIANILGHGKKRLFIENGEIVELNGANTVNNAVSRPLD